MISNYGYVIVRPNDAEEVSQGGIILGAADTSEVRRGTLVSAGIGGFQSGVRVESQLKGYEGKVVLFGRKSGLKINPTRSDSDLLMAVADVLAIED